MRRIPWKNGLGFTEEILAWRPDGDSSETPFLWRISRAAVDQDGPFSVFPGVDRTIVVLSGKGMVLSHGIHAPPATVLPLAPYAFSGDWTTHAKLLAGPVVDFNVMADRTFARTHVAVQDLVPGQDLPDEQADHILVHVIRGKIVRASIYGMSSVELTASDSILFATSTRADSGGIYQATEETSLLVARIWRRGA